MHSTTLPRASENLRDVHGRGMNVHSDVYKLPADSEEHDLMYSGVGLYPPEVEDAVQRLLLSDHRSVTAGDSAHKTSPAILDLGSGSGIWAAEMAAVYPHAKVVGLDLTEPKLRFVTADLTKGLDPYRESFEVVHCRCVAGHVNDRGKLLREIVKVLKPGGLLLLGDGNFHLFRPDGSRISPASPSSPQESKEGSWLLYWLNQTVVRSLSMTIDPEHAGGEYLGWLIRQDSELEFVGEKAYFSPLRLKGPSSEKDYGQKMQDGAHEDELTRLMSRNIENFLTASKPILLSAGIPEETIDDWRERSRAEIREQVPSETWLMQWHMAWATKNDVRLETFKRMEDGVSR